jgi:hypothetical protein
MVTGLFPGDTAIELFIGYYDVSFFADHFVIHNPMTKQGAENDNVVAAPTLHPYLSISSLP